MTEEDRAVLFVLRDHKDEPLTPHNLFELLPRTLRDRWSVDYLADWILRNFIRADFVRVRQAGPGLLNYVITPKGEFASVLDDVLETQPAA